jgi:hypothetical protein
MMVKTASHIDQIANDRPLNLLEIGIPDEAAYTALIEALGTEKIRSSSTLAKGPGPLNEDEVIQFLESARVTTDNTVSVVVVQDKNDGALLIDAIARRHFNREVSAPEGRQLAELGCYTAFKPKGGGRFRRLDNPIRHDLSHIHGPPKARQGKKD